MNKYKLPKKLKQSLDNKRIILTASSGRCGTMLLSKLLNISPHVDAIHEPKPVVDDVWWRLRADPNIAYKWLIKSKLPSIVRDYHNPTYIETSHLLCKGFFEPLHALGVDFDLIILTRAHYRVALSMYLLNDIPGRTTTGKRWFLSPNDPGNMIELSENIIKSLTDYQLCYWYCLEMERREKHYYNLWRERDRLVVSTTLDDIQDKETFRKLITELGIPPFSLQEWFAHKATSPVRFNEKSSRKHHLLSRGVVKFPVGDFEEERRELEKIIDSLE